MNEMSLATAKAKIKDHTRGDKTPLITVVTPCLNSIQTIADNLKSVIDARRELNTNGWELEHIIVEGGSSDGTLELITGHIARHTFCKSLSGITGGPYPAMNAGLKQSSGIFTHVLNADDYIMNTRAYADLIIRGKYLNAEAMICSIAYLRRPKNKITRLWIVEETGDESYKWQLKLQKGLHYPHPGFIARTKRYRAELFDECYTLSADYKLMQNILIGLNSTNDVLVETIPVVAMAEGGATSSWGGRIEGWRQLNSINRELGIKALPHIRYFEKIKQILRTRRKKELIKRPNEE
ncbi:glycosyltransferase [Synechococcus sp. AH-224-G16]|nr:glycosyltransferase [Synechococcus sp. AH-224-G16]